MFYAEGNDSVEDNTDDEWTKWITIDAGLLRGWVEESAPVGRLARGSNRGTSSTKGGNTKKYR